MSAQPQANRADASNASKGLDWLESVTPEQRMTLYRLYMKAAELGAQAEGERDDEKDLPDPASQHSGSAGKTEDAPEEARS